jgi:signal transduction histidine kinase
MGPDMSGRSSFERLFRPWMGGAALLLMAAAAWFWVFAEGKPDAPALIELRSASFESLDPGRPAAPQVSLPDTWSLRGLSLGGRGQYRASFELSAVPSGVWALRVDRLSTSHEIWVNGVLVHGTWTSDPGALRRPVFALISLPQALLHAGRNDVLVKVDCRLHAGLSTLIVGPWDAVTPEFNARRDLQVELPRQLNSISIGVCLVALLVWWRRRNEAALGAFAALGLLTSVRNFGYYAESPLGSVALLEWLFFASHVVSATLVGWFATAVTGQRTRVPAMVWTGMAVLALTVGAIAAALGRMPVARGLVYPVLLLGSVLALTMVWRSLRRLPSSSLAALVLGMGGVLVAGLHDYLYVQGRVSIMGSYWMPLAIPVAVTAFAGRLVSSVVQAMLAAESLNATLEQRVSDRTEALEEANNAKGRFVAAASHDLRQPVATIGLLVGLLHERVKEAGLRDLVSRIDQAVAALESLLKGLLDLSRLEAGMVQPSPSHVELQTVFDAIAAHEGEAARAQGIALHFRPTPLAVVSDPVLLEQMLRNLVSNAVRCTTCGGVLVTARARGEQVLLQVWDTGVGMTPEQQVRAFDEFVQFDHTGPDGRVRGLGLGLAIVQRSARLLRHAITLRSEPGRGSCFTLVLPQDGRTRRRPVAEASLAEPLAAMQVLLVEDEAGVREALQARLQAWGGQVDAFEGMAALQKALAGSALLAPDLVLTDMRLPDGDGLAVMDLLRQHGMNPAVLVVTGNTLPSELARLQRSGVPVLHKPFRAEALLAAIQTALR